MQVVYYAKCDVNLPVLTTNKLKLCHYERTLLILKSEKNDFRLLSILKNGRNYCWLLRQK